MQNGDHPTNTNFTFKQAMERQNEVFQITVCPSQLQHVSSCLLAGCHGNNSERA